MEYLLHQKPSPDGLLARLPPPFQAGSVVLNCPFFLGKSFGREAISNTFYVRIHVAMQKVKEKKWTVLITVVSEGQMACNSRETHTCEPH